MLLTPARMIAPVGSEVVLRAGICRSDGHYVTRQPVEWLLSQESVGQFVQVGQSRELCRLLHHSPRKFSNNFALTRTSTAAQVITRGTPDVSDDVNLLKGQTWITVTSATGGMTHVTAVGTGEENWEERRQTATIHWVDAQWTLPVPAVVRAGEPHLLSTKVSRSSSGGPASNWIVRYEIVEGASARLGQTQQTSVDVRTDAEGKADVSVINDSAQPGTTKIRIQILMPPRDGGEPVAVGEGFTTITWSAAGLTLRVSGPEAAASDAEVSYRVEVANPGDLTTTNVELVAELPDGLVYRDSSPRADEFGRQLSWQLGDLGARQSQFVVLTCRTQLEGDMRLRLKVNGGEDLTADTLIITRVIAPSLDIHIDNPPTSAKVGERVHFNVEVRNIGAYRVTNIIVRDRFEEGLEHSFGQPSPIEKTLGDLDAGLGAQFGISFFVRQPGRLCHTIQAFGDGGHTISREVCIDVAQPTLDLSVEVQGPDRSQLGEQVEYEIRVSNSGEGNLTDLRVFFEPATSLVPRLASQGWQPTANGLVWGIGSLIPNETQVRRVSCECLQEDPAAASQITVTTAEGVTRSADARTTIAAPPRRSETEPAFSDEDAPSLAASGDLQISLAESANPIEVNQNTTYYIEISNDRNVADKEVEVSFEIPPGLQFERFRSDSVSLQPHTEDGRKYTVDTIAELRPNQIRRLQVEVKALTAGSHTFRVLVKSLRTAKPLAAEKATRVYDQN